MPLTINTLVNGQPMSFNVNEMHITSNDANSINVVPSTAPPLFSDAAPPMFQQAQNPQPLFQNGESAVNPYQSQQQAQAMQQEQQNRMNSFNANNAMINKSLQEKSLQKGLSAVDRENIANTHQDLHNQNYQTHFGVNPGNKVEMLQPGVKKIGGTRNLRNKRKKRTRKQRRSRKRFAKR